MKQVLLNVGQTQAEEIEAFCNKLPTEGELPTCIRRRGPGNIGNKREY